MTPKLEWKPAVGRYVSGEDCWAGRIKVGTAHYDGARRRDDPNKWRAGCTLPGIALKEQTFLAIEEAKARVERAVAVWFEAAFSEENQHV